MSQKGGPIPVSTPDTSSNTTPAGAFRKSTRNKNSRYERKRDKNRKEESKVENNEKDYGAIKLKISEQLEMIKCDPKLRHLVTSTDNCETGDNG